MDQKPTVQIMQKLDEMEEVIRNIKALIFMTTFDKEDTLSILMEEAGKSIIDALAVIDNKTKFDETMAHLEISRVEAILSAMINQLEYYLQLIAKNEEKKMLHSLATTFIEKVLDSIEILYTAW